jgi:homoserine O-acetyltransferase
VGAGWNIAARAAVAIDPERGLEVARMFAMLSYRSHLSLELTQSGESPVQPASGPSRPTCAIRAPS